MLWLIKLCGFEKKKPDACMRLYATHKTATDYSRLLAVDIIFIHVYSELIVNFKTQNINCAYGARNSLI